MWSTEKFGAVSSRGQEAARRASISLNPTGHSVFDQPFILSTGPRLFCVRLRRKCGKLNRQTPIYRNHPKSQKTNNRDQLKSPKNQFLQDHKSCACGMIDETRIAGHGSRLLPATSHLLALTREGPLACPDEGRATGFLTGSASRVEITVTYSKQRTARILPGSRIARKRSSNQSKFTPDSVRGTRVAVHGSRLLLTAAFRYNAPGPIFSREARNLT
jgi:hypothetical protein